MPATGGKNPGRVERAILDILTEGARYGERWQLVSSLTYRVFDISYGTPLPEARDRSVRRALRRMIARGVVKTLEIGKGRGFRGNGGFYYGLVNGPKPAKRRRHKLSPAQEAAKLVAKDRQMFVKSLGMLGSEHAGERDNAAVTAERLRRKLGLGWNDLLR